MISFIFKAFQCGLKLVKKNPASGIHNKGNTGYDIGGAMTQINKLWQKQYRQIINTEKAQIFQRPQRGTLAGAGQTAYYYYTDLFHRQLKPRSKAEPLK